ncbi:hypothetical protein HanPI659440_Chr16g0621391 [Helianthus annuus]|nr:hypothetical protein HanPI659440_Chr16g0621391 [Helianthus annuus]
MLVRHPFPLTEARRNRAGEAKDHHHSTPPCVGNFCLCPCLLHSYNHVCNIYWHNSNDLFYKGRR